MDETPYKITFYHGGFWKTSKKGVQEYMYAKQKTVMMNEEHCNMLTLTEEEIYVSQWAAGHNVILYLRIPKSSPPKYERLTTDIQLSKLFRENSITRKISIWLSVEEGGKQVVS
ncbi:hypothetical protein QJS10_CPA16g00607 [Acorus calamus]|uniref:Uncharacterized protein n=1 Tax=Acorus calamus TaxID=4465 RepID=A0AAV9CZP4_ACOCL|nr:hypothetical protein QJS10_CPA16g00607 [Acorus calamus]